MGFFSKVAKKLGNIIGDVFSWITGIEIPDVDDFQNGVLLNKQSNVEPLPVIYGTRKVGGTRVFVATSGSDNTYLYVILALCEGEIELINTVYINDIPSTDSRFSGLITITKYIGTDSQTADPTFTGASPSIGWTSDHRLRGIAYLAMRFSYNQDVFGGGLPNVTAIVEGKKCYDPRTATTIYTNNPAICLRDYLVNTRYGKGLDSSLIDDTSFSSAADDCDALVSKYTGAVGTDKLFTCNAVINTGQNIFENVKIFLTGMRGLLPFSNGVYSLIIEDDFAPSFAFDTTNIVGGISISSAGKASKYNKVTAKFTNPDTNWQSDTVTWPAAGSSDSTTFLSEDNSIELAAEITLPTITDFYAARDIARVVCLGSRLATLSIELTATAEAIEVAVGDVVTLTSPTPGWTDKEFLVTQMRLMDNGEVHFSMREHTASIFPWITDAEAEAVQQSNLPDPFSVEAPTSFVITESTFISEDGSAVPEIYITWTAANDAFVELYEVQGKLQSLSDWVSVITADTQIYERNQIVGETYDLRVRAINALGVRSAWLTDTYTPTGDIVAPSPVTSLTAVALTKSVALSWVPPSDKDVGTYNIYEYTSNSFGSSSVVGIASGSTYTRTGLNGNATKYYWVTAVDRSGNESTEVASGAVTTQHETGVASVSTFSGLSGEYVGQLVYLSTDYSTYDGDTIYKWSGSDWIPEIIDTNGLVDNAATVFEGAQGDLNVVLEQTTSTSYLDWSYLGDITVSFGDRSPTELYINIRASFEAQGTTDANTLSMGLTANGSTYAIGDAYVAAGANLAVAGGATLDAAAYMTPTGTWDASTGSFPASSTEGKIYSVTVGGTVDGVSFFTDNLIYAKLASASTTTFDGNWGKLVAAGDVDFGGYVRATDVTTDDWKIRVVYFSVLGHRK